MVCLLIAFLFVKPIDVVEDFAAFWIVGQPPL